MNINELKKSKYLKKEDCGNGIVVTIRQCMMENVAKQGEPEEEKAVLYFVELEKPIVVNSTNAQLIAAITGSEETDDWNGHKIVLYSDPNVTNMQGKVVGGIRVRAPKQAPKAGVKQGVKPALAEDVEDPFA